MRLSRGKDFHRVAGRNQTLRRVSVQTGIRPKKKLVTEHGWVTLGANGVLSMKKGYVWDGASGPTWDTKSTYRASLVHDALYQLMREKLLDAAEVRDRADHLLRRLMLDDLSPAWRRSRFLRGLHHIRATAWLAGVRVGGWWAAR